MFKGPKNADNLDALKSDGTVALHAEGVGVVLVTGGTYFFCAGGDYAFGGECPLSSFHVKWDTAYVGSFVVETSNFALKTGRPDFTGPSDVSDIDTTVGNWLQENPSTAYISVTTTDGGTSGATVSNATVTVAGGTAGGAMIHVGNLGARRIRLRVNVTTGGALRVGALFKGMAGASA